MPMSAERPGFSSRISVFTVVVTTFVGATTDVNNGKMAGSFTILGCAMVDIFVEVVQMGTVLEECMATGAKGIKMLLDTGAAAARFGGGAFCST